MSKSESCTNRSTHEKLEAASSGGSPGKSVRAVLESAEVEVFEPEEVTRMDDNGVNVNEQMVEAVRNAYQLQYVMQSISTDLSVLKMAIRGQ